MVSTVKSKILSAQQEVYRSWYFQGPAAWMPADSEAVRAQDMLLSCGLQVTRDRELIGMANAVLIAGLRLACVIKAADPKLEVDPWIPVRMELPTGPVESTLLQLPKVDLTVQTPHFDLDIDSTLADFDGCILYHTLPGIGYPNQSKAVVKGQVVQFKLLE